MLLRGIQALRRGWRGDILALLAGLVLPLAFAPYYLIPIVFISPAILFGLWRNADWHRNTWRGYLFGLGFFGVGVSWVAVSMYRFGGVAMPLAGALTFLYVLIWALFPTLVAYIHSRYCKRLPAGMEYLLVLPSLWVLLEWSRGWVFTGFPWLALGNTQTDGPFAGLVPVLGVYGVSWMILFTAGLLVLLIYQRGRSRIWVGAALVAALSMGYAFQTHTWGQPHGESISASLLQGNIEQDVKWRREYKNQSIDLYTRMTRENWASDLIIWPETALPAFYHQAKDFLDGLGSEARVNNSTLLIGLPYAEEHDPSRYYNSVAAVGLVEGLYNKRHLVPFGEYLPLKFMLGELLHFLQIPMADFSRGAEQQPPIVINGARVSISICYEDVFGEEVIHDLPEANFLVNVSNDAWFGDSLSPHQHLQMARMRAMETARPMLRGTNNGVSAVIDYNGKLLAISPQFETTVLNGSIQPRSGATPYVLFGNYPVLVMIALSLGLAGYRYRSLGS